MSSPIRRHLPNLLIGLSTSLIMVGAYLVVGFAVSSQPKVTWATVPVTVSFTATSPTSSDSLGDSFTCSPSTSGVTLVASVSQTKISLSVSPSSFASCGTAPNSVRLTAMCHTTTAALCRGTYSGLVRVRQPANYRDLPANLQITVVVK